MFSKAKTELQKLCEQPDDSVIESEANTRKNSQEPIDETSNMTVKAIADNYRRVRLFNNDTELYRALKYQSFNTTLVFNDTKKIISSQLAITNSTSAPKTLMETSEMIQESEQTQQDVEVGEKLATQSVEEQPLLTNETPLVPAEEPVRKNSVKISVDNNIVHPADSESENDTDNISGLSDESESCFGNTYDRSIENMSMMSGRNIESSYNGEFELEFEDEDKK